MPLQFDLLHVTVNVTDSLYKGKCFLEIVNNQLEVVAESGLNKTESLQRFCETSRVIFKKITTAVI